MAPLLVENRLLHVAQVALAYAGAVATAFWLLVVAAIRRSRAVDGVVPTAALTTGPADTADKWWKGFRGEVVAEAKSRGLSEDLWSARSKALVTVAAIPAAVLFGIAVPVYGAGYFAIAAI